ncbi:ricin-type beta-trefoil lectin domain protein [Streptomyces sp. NPDC054956]
MSRPGRPPGPLKGRTDEANALAQFLRDLTAEYTVSQLEQRYEGSRSVWSEYRSGQKIIPLSRLKRVVEDRFARDARTREQKLQEARGLYTAATAAAAAVPPASDAASAADGGSVSVADVPSESEAESEAESESESETRADADGTVVSRSVAGPGPRAGGRGERLRRWRTPAQWGALAVLVAVLVIANRPDHVKDPAAEASSPQDPGQDQQSSAPVEPGPSPELSQTPEASAPAPGPSAEPVAPPASQGPVPGPGQPAPSKKNPPPPAEGLPAGAPPSSFFQRTLRNVTTGKCLDIAAEGIPNQGSRIAQFDCGAGSGHKQAFDLVDGVDGFLIRSSDQPRLCIDLGDLEAPKTASYVGLYPCQNTTGDNQLWYRKWNVDQSAFLLVNAKSERAGRPMCLDVDDYSVKINGQRVGVFPCNYTGGDDHWWTLP